MIGYDPKHENSLSLKLKQRIKQCGPVRFRDWMDAALYDREGGYYMRGDRIRWGRQGDYRTSPERTQLFGRTFARYFARLHKELGSPDRLTVFEGGAGQCDFAFQVLSTLRESFPETFSTIQYVIDEVGRPAVESLRSRLLSEFGNRVEFTHFSAIQSPASHAIVFSNELLDAFPVHRVVMRNGRLLEYYVGLSSSDSFEWIESEPSTIQLADHFKSLNVALREGQIAEVNLAVSNWLSIVSRIFDSGYVITVDYGAEAADLLNASLRPEGTLRSFFRHQLTKNLLAQPGEQDLTSTVNWTQVENVGAELGLRTTSRQRLDRFLLDAGLLDELKRANKSAMRETKAGLALEAREMILPSGMASSFDVLVQRK